MIRHVVLMRVPETAVDRVADVVACIAALQVEGFIGVEAGPNQSPETRDQATTSVLSPRLKTGMPWSDTKSIRNINAKALPC